ncbi:glycerophosphodiester phosphodiesterase [Nakamurella sp.]|uniref:glycerophosphodiester phosphodiesterase n=1 Tax=Nakamurella sp. TaxID=1869182 RepID=UPI003784E015
MDATSPDPVRLPVTLRHHGGPPWVIAHRGASARRPENTLSAFLAAWHAGVVWVEADTQPTADGVPVLLHDRDLDRTTTGRGPVRAARRGDVARLTVRGWPGEWVPRLAELLAMLTPTRALLLELKGYHTSAQVRTVLGEIDEAGVTDRVLLQSFEVEVLRELHRADPDRPFGLLVTELDADPVARCRDLGAGYYHPSAGALLRRPDVVPALHAAGIGVACWTADDPGQWAALTGAGVDGIITNRPTELATWQRRR